MQAITFSRVHHFTPIHQQVTRGPWIHCFTRWKNCLYPDSKVHGASMGSDRTQVGPMLVTRTLLSGYMFNWLQSSVGLDFMATFARLLLLKVLPTLNVSIPISLWQIFDYGNEFRCKWPMKHRHNIENRFSIWMIRTSITEADISIYEKHWSYSCICLCIIFERPQLRIHIVIARSMAFWVFLSTTFSH